MHTLRDSQDACVGDGSSKEATLVGGKDDGGHNVVLDIVEVQARLEGCLGE